MEKEYILKIFNYGGNEVYHEITTAEDENEAVKKLLNRIYLNNGDSIRITENYDD